MFPQTMGGVERGRQHAHNGDGLAVEVHDATDHGRIGGVVPKPLAPREEGDLGGGRCAVGQDKAAAELRLDAEQRQKIFTDNHALDLPGRLARLAKLEGIVTVMGDVFEGCQGILKLVRGPHG